MDRGSLLWSRKKWVTRTCSEGPRLVPYVPEKAADLQNRSSTVLEGLKT